MAAVVPSRGSMKEDAKTSRGSLLWFPRRRHKQTARCQIGNGSLLCLSRWGINRPAVFIQAQQGRTNSTWIPRSLNKVEKEWQEAPEGSMRRNEGCLYGFLQGSDHLTNQHPHSSAPFSASVLASSMSWATHTQGWGMGRRKSCHDRESLTVCYPGTCGP